MTVSPKLGKQALKSQQTREKLLNASVEVIKEKGYAAASAKEIASRAGITWGAAQHHFGTKEEILLEILNRSHRLFIRRMSDPDLQQGSLEERAARFVDVMWQHYQEDLYLAAIEILSAMRETSFGPSMPPFTDEHIEQLRSIFPDSEVSSTVLQEALLFAHFCLTGMTMERVLERKSLHFNSFINHCKRTVADIISGSANR